MRASWGEQSGGEAKPGAVLWFSFTGVDVSRGQRGGGPWRVVASGGEAMAETGRFWLPPAYGAMRESEWKERDRDSGSFVNNPKFKTQFCNFKFSPSWLQMKKKLISFLFSFLRSTTFVLCTFSFEQWFVS